MESFIVNRSLTRDIKTSALQGSILKNISENHAELFRNMINNSDAETKYHNILQSRNDTAHTDSINMSFGELYKSYESAADVLTIFSNVLNS